MQASHPLPSAKRPAGRSFLDAAAVARALQPSYPVYCLRPALLAETAKRFISMFPGTVLYAVKCNPSPFVLDELYKAGIRHFDTASLTEIAQICETYPRAHAYFMHPVKGRAVIKNAYSVYGIRPFRGRSRERARQGDRGDRRRGPGHHRAPAHPSGAGRAVSSRGQVRRRAVRGRRDPQESRRARLRDRACRSTSAPNAPTLRSMARRSRSPAR